jgi:hypothetical protein
LQQLSIVPVFPAGGRFPGKNFPAQIDPSKETLKYHENSGSPQTTDASQPPFEAQIV